jgi:Tfp pilus assembly protein PilN
MIRLNVIGQTEQKGVNDLLRSHVLLYSLLVTVGISAIAVIILIIGRSYFTISLTTVQNELSTTKLISPAGKTLPVLELTKKINDELAVLEAPLTDYRFDTVLTDLKKAAPSGITFTSISLASKNGSLTAEGFAASRNDVPLFESNLKLLPYLTAVVLQSSLNERTHVPVSVTATIDRSKFVSP